MLLVSLDRRRTSPFAAIAKTGEREKRGAKRRKREKKDPKRRRRIKLSGLPRTGIYIALNKDLLTD